MAKRKPKPTNAAAVLADYSRPTVERQAAYAEERRRLEAEREKIPGYIEGRAIGRLSGKIRYMCLVIDKPERLYTSNLHMREYGTRTLAEIQQRPYVEPPKSLDGRFEMAFRQYWDLLMLVEIAIGEAERLPQIPEVLQAKVFLRAFSNELADDAYEEAECVGHRAGTEMLCNELIRVGKILRTELALTIARLDVVASAMVRGHPSGARWSPPMKVSRWLSLFDQAGCRVSESTLERRIDSGEFLAHPSRKRGNLRLDINTLPPEMRSEDFWNSVFDARNPSPASRQAVTSRQMNGSRLA